MNECVIETCKTDLESLRKLTDLIVKVEEENYRELKVDSGFCSLHGLFKTDKVAISCAYAEAGTRVGTHSHEALEVMGVYQGRMEVNIDGVELNIPEMEIVVVDANIPHSVYFPEETRLWGVTMPASISFPKGLDDEKLNNKRYD